MVRYKVIVLLTKSTAFLMFSVCFFDSRKGGKFCLTNLLAPRVVLALLRACTVRIKASSYEPGRPGWLGFATLFFIITKISMCSYENAGWPGYRDRCFLRTRSRQPSWKFFPYEHRSPSRNAVPRVFGGPFGHFSSR